jgi:hypothetical protein
MPPLRKISILDQDGMINDMSRTDKKSESPKKDDDKSPKSPHAAAEQDDYEDGDFATPKRDRYGEDDQPL